MLEDKVLILRCKCGSKEAKKGPLGARPDFPIEPNIRKEANA
jgi:hypothetical protein